MDAGLNLYSLNKQIQTETDFLETVLKLKNMGYSYLQYSGAAFDVKRIKKMLAEVGLPIVLTHVPMDRILNDTDRLIDEHLDIGCKNIGLGAMPLDAIVDEDLCKTTVKKLNATAEKMNKRGAKFFYHHHHFEFSQMKEGVTIFDYMINNAPYINFTLDTYWLQYGGVSILEYIEKCKGRIECVHLKDYAVCLAENKQFSPIFVPVGNGNIRFENYKKNLTAAGVKYFLVEQDNATGLPDPFNEVKQSIDYIKNNL